MKQLPAKNLTALDNIAKQQKLILDLMGQIKGLQRQNIEKDERIAGPQG